MFKQKPQEDRDSPKAAAGGKGSLLRRRWKLLAVGGCVLVAAGVLAARQLAAPAAAETTYIEVTPQRRSITNVFSESGTIEAANSYEVKSLVRGEVLTAGFEEGDMVEKGTVLLGRGYPERGQPAGAVGDHRGAQRREPDVGAGGHRFGERGQRFGLGPAGLPEVPDADRPVGRYGGSPLHPGGQPGERGRRGDPADQRQSDRSGGDGGG